MEYQLDMALYNGIFAVPNAIIDDYLKLASGNTLKVLLVLLRHSGSTVSLKELEKSTGLTEHEVYDALTFWSDLEILSIGKSSATFETTLSEDSSHQEIPTEREVSSLTPPENPLSTPSTVPSTPSEKPTPKFQIISNSLPRPTVTEAVQYIEASEELTFLINQYRQTFGKDPDSFVCCSMVALFHWCDLSAESLALLISYYHSIGVKSWQTIERKIVQCKENGIDTYEKTESYILSQSHAYKNESEVRRIFGLQNRELTTREKTFIHQWYDDFHYNATLITMAFERSADSTGKLSFPYIHKILETWHEKNIRTPEEAQSEMSNGKQRKESSGNFNGTSKPSSRKYADTSYDLDELEKKLLYNHPDFSKTEN